MMRDSVFRVSPKGSDVSDPRDLLVDFKYPHWKCDLKPVPKHYGVIDAVVSIPAGQSKVLFTIEHGYTYAPSFLVVWDYPAGAGFVNQTYGVGVLEDFLPLSCQFNTTVDNRDFTITVDNSINSAALSSVPIQFRYYIFAEDFPLYNYIPELGVGL